MNTSTRTYVTCIMFLGFHLLRWPHGISKWRQMGAVYLGLKRKSIRPPFLHKQIYIYFFSIFFDKKWRLVVYGFLVGDQIAFILTAYYLSFWGSSDAKSTGGINQCMNLVNLQCPYPNIKRDNRYRHSFNSCIKSITWSYCVGIFRL